MLSWLYDLCWLVFPEVCMACNKALNTGEKCICTSCRFRLPKTNYHHDHENPVVKQFWGKVPVHSAAAYYHFSKGEKVQRLIHALKYKGKQEVGIFVGELYGQELKSSHLFEGISLVVPVPLHPAKLRTRGYNQSDCFAEGLSIAMEIPFDPNGLKRLKKTETQTRKHRFDRYRNVDQVFTAGDPDKLSGKKILLVDDVVTTGSTLIACAEALLEVPGTQVSIVAIACA